MAKIAADLLIEHLIDWSVDTAFGLPRMASWRRSGPVGTESASSRERPRNGRSHAA
jgi:hypothetical protein